MRTRQPLRRAVGRTLLAGGVALAGVALASGTAQAEPDFSVPAPGMSEVGELLASCDACQSLLPVLAAAPDILAETGLMDELPGGFSLPGLG